MSCTSPSSVVTAWVLYYIRLHDTAETDFMYKDWPPDSLQCTPMFTMTLQQKSRSLMNLSRATGYTASPRHARNKVL